MTGNGGSEAAGQAARLRAAIRAIPDHPKPGVLFRDITPLLADADAFAAAVDALAAISRGWAPDVVLAAEARGFVFGAPLARELGAGFVPARRPDRLPAETVRAAFALEYGDGELHVHRDAITPGTRVLVHDDLLATGGTAAALCELAEQLGAEIVGCCFLIELAGLDGRARLAPHHVRSVIEEPGA